MIIQARTKFLIVNCGVVVSFLSEIKCHKSKDNSYTDKGFREGNGTLHLNKLQWLLRGAINWIKFWDSDGKKRMRANFTSKCEKICQENATKCRDSILTVNSPSDFIISFYLSKTYLQTTQPLTIYCLSNWNFKKISKRLSLFYFYPNLHCVSHFYYPRHFVI